MALIQCWECSQSMSSMAASCPKCGAPNRAPQPAAPLESQVVTTQQTAKSYKAIQTLGALVMIGSVVGCMNGQVGIGSAAGFFGFLLYLGGRFGAWWDHG